MTSELLSFKCVMNLILLSGDYRVNNLMTYKS